MSLDFIQIRANWDETDIASGSHAQDNGCYLIKSLQWLLSTGCPCKNE